MVLKCSQCFSRVLKGSLRFSGVLRGSQWFSKVFRGSQWFSVVLNGSQWLSWVYRREGADVRADAVVDTESLGGGEVENKSPLVRGFLGDHAQFAGVYARKELRREWP